jgi:transposase
MWTTKNRVRYHRDPVRSPSDVTEEEGGGIAPLIPPARRGGRKRSVKIREVFNGVLYMLRTGWQGRAIPKELPPRSTLFHSLAGGRPMGHCGGFSTSGRGRVGSRRSAARAPAQGSSTVSG